MGPAQHSIVFPITVPKIGHATSFTAMKTPKKNVTFTHNCYLSVKLRSINQWESTGSQVLVALREPYHSG